MDLKYAEYLIKVMEMFAGNFTFSNTFTISGHNSLHKKNFVSISFVHVRWGLLNIQIYMSQSTFKCLYEAASSCCPCNTSSY